MPVTSPPCAVHTGSPAAGEAGGDRINDLPRAADAVRAVLRAAQKNDLAVRKLP